MLPMVWENAEITEASNENDSEKKGVEANFSESLQFPQW